MTAILKADDEFKRVLGYLPNDDMLDDQVTQHMTSALNAAETYVQGAVPSLLSWDYIMAARCRKSARNS